MKTLKDQPQHRLAYNLIIFIAFLATAQMGIYYYREIGTSPATIWAPVGIAIAGVILAGPAIWPGIALASIVNGLLSNSHPFLIFGMTLGSVLQPLVAFYFLKRADLNRKLATVKDMFLILATSFFVTMIVPTFNVLTVNLYNNLYGADRPTFWLSWWIGGVLSALTLTPFLIRWFRYPMDQRSKLHAMEIIIALCALCAISYFLFATDQNTIYGFSLIYPLLAVLFWLTFRTNSRIMTLALFLMATISLAGALYGTYNPTATGLSGRVFSSEVFDIVVGTIFFILVSVEEQRKSAQEEMREKNAKLQEAMDRIRENDEAKNEFIATLAHELRNPLAAFLSSAELLMLEESMDRSQVKKLAEMMESRVRTMGRLLDDLLDISRVSRGKMELRKEDVSLREVVKNSIHSLEPLLQKNRHSYTEELPREDIILHADPVRLEQIVVNLLSNAIKYTPPGGQIGLRAEYKDGWASLVVSDTGVGIPPEMINKIFESFVQIKNDHKATSGLGIGLALTKTLVEMHGGSISAKSDDKGSEFTVKLPASSGPEESANQPSAAAQPETPSAQAPLPSGKFKILVVDDNVEAAMAIGKLLQLRGHLTSVVHDGQGALQEIQSSKPDVVLLDIGLPDMDGYEVARKVRAFDHVPVLIAVTGFGQLEDKERARTEGFHHHLTKPVGLADIEDVLGSLAQD